MGEIGVGIIGTGFMGECHALAFTSVVPLFQPELRPRLEMVADINGAAAERARSRFGFARASADWPELVADPRVGLVSITAPNILHKEMALAAIAAGKHVYCEKPLALTAEDTKELTLAAEAAGVRTLVGYNYLCSPALQHIKQLLDSGELGALTYLRASFDEDYMADPAVPFSWRCERAKAGSGALGDLGSHAISVARFLGGPIVEVLGDIATVVPERAVAPPGGDLQFGRVEQPSEMRTVENEDIAHCLLRFQSGVLGSLTTSRVAWGRKNGPDLELYGTLGGVRYRQERFNEYELFRSSSRQDDNGYRTVFCGPYHGAYGHFTPAPGHGIGFNDLKVIEVASLLQGIATGGRLDPDFREGWAIEAVCDAILESAQRRAWVPVEQPG
jgi:predicted dehydrogenase